MADKLMGEMLDLQHGSAFMKNANINASTGTELEFISYQILEFITHNVILLSLIIFTFIMNNY